MPTRISFKGIRSQRSIIAGTGEPCWALASSFPHAKRDITAGVSKDMDHQGLRSGEPAQCLNLEPLVARPSDEGVWQPMRPDIGRPCQGTAISMASSHKQGMATLICREARNDLHILTLLDLHLVHPKQGGPWCVEPQHDGMRRHRYFGDNAFRCFEAVVIGNTGNRQDLSTAVLCQRALPSIP